jgi:hypothetical protein
MSSLATLFEEEREVGFEKFYPMTLGEVVNEKYKVVAKLASDLQARYGAVVTWRE